MQNNIPKSFNNKQRTTPNVVYKHSNIKSPCQSKKMTGRRKKI
jgi:hypothetical protein